jgi:hypothetical protein
MSRAKQAFSYPRDVCFECTRCALCCGDTKSRTRHVLLLREEAQTISKAVLQAVEAFAVEIKGQEPYAYEMKKTAEEGKCLFLEGRNCIVYELRPLVCRFYPFELRAKKDGKHRFFYTQECPGIGKGKKLERNHFEQLFKRAHRQLGTQTTRGVSTTHCLRPPRVQHTPSRLFHVQSWNKG